MTLKPHFLPIPLQRKTQEKENSKRKEKNRTPGGKAVTVKKNFRNVRPEKKIERKVNRRNLMRAELNLRPRGIANRTKRS